MITVYSPSLTASDLIGQFQPRTTVKVSIIFKIFYKVQQNFWPSSCTQLPGKAPGLLGPERDQALLDHSGSQQAPVLTLHRPFNIFKEVKRNTLYSRDTLKDQGNNKNKGNGSSVSFTTCKTTALLLLFRLLKFTSTVSPSHI